MKLLRMIALIVLSLVVCSLCLQAQDSLPDTAQPSTADTTLSRDTAASVAQTDSSITGQSGILYQNGKPLYPLSPERLHLLQKYAQVTNTWRFVEFLSGLLVLGIILFTGLSARLSDFAHLARKRYLIIWLYTALILVVVYVLSFPFDYYRNFYVEAQYGFMNQTFVQWLGESLLNLLVMIVLMPLPVFLFYWVVERFRRWWLVFSAIAVPLMVFFIVIAPVVISPLFNKYEPLTDKRLEQQILTLASKAGIEGSDVFEVNASKQSSKVNAYVTGLFGSKRIVLYDTLIKGFTYDEIKFVMGHEMGHYVMRHIWWGLMVAVVFLFLALWVTDKTIHRTIHRFRHHFRFERMSELASLPLVLAFVSIISFFGQPIFNGLSRYMEHESDRYGLTITDISADAAASTFEKLSAYNLSDPNPNPLMEFWFYSHPALNKRIAFAREFRKGA